MRLTGGGGGGVSADLFDMLKGLVFEPQSDYQPGSSNNPWRFLSVQLKTTVDHKACLFFQSLPNPPHQCQHCESYEVSRSLRNKFPAKITNKQPKRRVKNHPNFCRVNEKHHIPPPLPQITNILFGLCVHRAVEN